MRRRLLLPAVAAAVCGVVGVSEAAGAEAEKASPKNGPHCARRGSSTIYADRGLRVYEFARDYDTLTYACLKSKNLRRRLALTYEDNSSYFSGFQVRRPWLGYTNSWSTKYGSFGTDIVALNLRTNRGTGVSRLFSNVYGFGFTRRPSIAWLESFDQYDPSPRVYSVYRYSHGSEGKELLDEGEDIDPTSFATAGKRIYWMKGGIAQTATMP